MTTRDDTKETKENTEANNDNAESVDKVSKAIEELVSQKEKSLDQQQREIQYNADLARMQGDQLEMQNQLAEAQKILLALKDESIEAEEGQKQLYHEQIAAQKELVNSIAKTMGMSKENREELLKGDKIIQKVSDSTKKYAKASEDMFNNMRGHVGFLFGDNKTGLVGGMFEFAASMNSAEGGLGTFGKSFMKVFNFTAIATAMVNNFIESTVGMVNSFNDAATSFAAATGTGDQFTGTLLEMRQEGNALGVTFENGAKALQSLVENQVGFLNSSKSAQKEMATQIALMERVGISTDVSTEMMNNFTINMGKSQKTAIQMTKALASMGGVLGSSQKFLQGFQESLKDLAVYGDGAVDVFSNLAAAARTAGIEVSTLTGLAAKFDTFAESAETVGRLNALLGSQLSSTEMLLMTEDQRVESLIQQVQISGESFAQMDRFKQKAIANAAGISDMNEAQRIFGMNMKEYGKYQKQMDRQAKMQENFNKAIEATIPFQEKFLQFTAEFAIFVQPIADIIGVVLDGMVSLMSSMGDGTKKLVLFGSAIGLAVVAFSGLGASLPIIGAATGVVAGGVGAITAAATAGGPAMVGLGSAAGGASVGMAAFALPLIGITLGITAVVGSFAYLIGQFVELANVGPEAVGVMVSFAAAIAAVSLSGGVGLLGAAGAMATMSTIVGSLAAMKAVIGEDTSAISNALENLALIATGASAKAMGGATVNIASELKGAVEALTTTKIDIKLSIDDGKLYDIMKGAVADVISKDAKTQAQIVTIARGI